MRRKLLHIGTLKICKRRLLLSEKFIPKCQGRSILMKCRREFRLRLILASLCLIASLLQVPSAFGQAANAAAQPHGAAGPVALQRGALEVWVPKSYVMGMMGDPTAPVSQDYQDRKSTRLNSSHLVISYAVFCLK